MKLFILFHICLIPSIMDDVKVPETAPHIDQFLDVSTIKSDWFDTPLQKEMALTNIDMWCGEFGHKTSTNPICVCPINVQGDDDDADDDLRVKNCPSCAATALDCIQRGHLPDDRSTLRIHGEILEQKTAQYDSVLVLSMDLNTPNHITHGFFKETDGFISCVRCPNVSTARQLHRKDCVEMKREWVESVTLEIEREWVDDALETALALRRSESSPSHYVGGIVVHRPAGKDWTKDAKAFQSAVLKCWAFQRHRDKFLNSDDEALFLVYSGLDASNSGLNVDFFSHMTVLWMIGDECVSIDLQQSQAFRLLPVAQSTLHPTDGSSPDWV